MQARSTLFLCAALALHCHPSANGDPPIRASCEGDGCIFEPGGENDPVLAMAKSAASSSTAPCTVSDCPAGYNVIVGTAGNDNLSGTNGSDCILGGDGNDTLNGAGGNDYLCGGNGDDQLNGSDGNDVMRGEAGNDTLIGGKNDDTLDGGDGDDSLDGGDDNDFLVGGNGNDSLIGGKNNDVLDGGNGNDTLSGGSDNDILVGGPGTDNLNGGAGTDTCDEVAPACESTSSACTAPKVSACTPANGRLTLVDETFTQGAGVGIWPENIGWDGDFNGDWYTDGATARPGNAINGSGPLPATTGFVKTLNLCPATGSRISMTAQVDASQSSTRTDTTLVLYFLGEACNTISITTSYPRFKNGDSTLAFYDAPVPSGTTRVIVAPMAYLHSNETSAVFYKRVTVTYEPSTAYQTVRTIASDDFSAVDAGTKQPQGWLDYGAEWFEHETAHWATLWNPKWDTPAGTLPKDTGIKKTYSLGSFNAGDVVDVKAFAATTYSDAGSHAQLRLIFNDAAQTSYDSNRLKWNNWDNLVIRRAPIPAGATTATVVINAYLGANETSSLYVDNMAFTLVRP